MSKKGAGSIKIQKILKRMLRSIRSSQRISISRVKEGFFSVYTINKGELKKFTVELVYLTHPEFLKLLKRAEDEFGFSHEGALVVPCGPQELERVLQHRDWITNT